MKVADDVQLALVNGWLVEVVDEHTCGTGPEGYYGAHEPGCGMVPIVRLDALPPSPYRTVVGRESAGVWFWVIYYRNSIRLVSGGFVVVTRRRGDAESWREAFDTAMQELLRLRCEAEFELELVS